MWKSVGAILRDLDQREAAFLAEAAHTPVRAVMVEKRGVCDLAEGTVLEFAHPGTAPDPGLCPGLLRALRPFLLATALGIPAGEPEGYLVSCPSGKGTVWRVER